MGAFKTGIVIGFGVGYLQGAKAGRRRYEQIQLKVKKLSGSPAVQKAIEPMRPMVAAKIETGKEMMGSVMSKAAGVKGGTSSSPKNGSSAT